ncbi:MAG: zinc-finger domain-containing protein [Gammaproteobacteria bacterium]|jgi:uncharacterized Zn-finger protein
MSNGEQEIADVSTSTETVFKITKDQLPLHCPLPKMSLWNQHPKVYIPIEETGKGKCPYCSSEFILEG